MVCETMPKLADKQNPEAYVSAALRQALLCYASKEALPVSVPSKLGYRFLNDVQGIPLVKTNPESEPSSSEDASYADNPDVRPTYLPLNERTLKLIGEAEMLVERLDGLPGRLRTEPLKKLRKICEILKGFEL